MLIELRKKNQITLPSEVIKMLHLKEGDVLTAEVLNQQIILKPAAVVPKDELSLLQDNLENYISSESVLKKDWLSSKEEEAWKHL